MNNIQSKTVLVTGANSGVGFEAAAQFAEAGWGKVVLACRSEEKAEAARALLVERTGRDPFEVLAVDTSEVASANAAVDTLRDRGTIVDYLVLNAGASGANPNFNSDGIEITWASTLVGHHVMTMRMLADGLLGPDAHVMITGSEGARGTVPGMGVHDIDAVAEADHGGDRAAAIDALARLKGPYSFKNMNEYVTAKMVVSWWAAALARRMPAGMMATSVSPGSAPSSNFARDGSLFMKAVLMPMFKIVGPFMKMGGSMEEAANRYLQAAELGVSESGGFYATADRKKAVGPMAVQTWPAYFLDEAKQEAGFEAVVKMTGTPYPIPTQDKIEMQVAG